MDRSNRAAAAKTAATLICALELERLKDPARLGPWPFEIGQQCAARIVRDRGD